MPLEDSNLHPFLEAPDSKAGYRTEQSEGQCSLINSSD
jgi:hypothetical protein